MSDQNKPYIRSGFARSSFAGVDYKPLDYAGSQFAPSQFASVGFVSGASLKDELVGRINIKDAIVAVVARSADDMKVALLIADHGFRVVAVTLSAFAHAPSARWTELVESGRALETLDVSALGRVDSVVLCGAASASGDAPLDAIGHPGMLLLLADREEPSAQALFAAAQQIEGLGQAKLGLTLFAARARLPEDLASAEDPVVFFDAATPACSEVARALLGAVFAEVLPLS